MESQNYLTIAIEKMGHVMLDDRHMKASDIYKTAVKLHKKEDYNPPSYNEDKFKVRSVFEKGGLCFYVMPKSGRTTEFFMYIHGGGFVSRITHNEWKFVFDTVERTGYGAVVPIYPLAPEHSVTEALDMLTGAYDKLCDSEDAQRLVLLGHSSGGCLALSLAIQLWKKGMRRPDKLILCSPVLDTEFEDTELEQKMSDKSRFMYRYYYTPEIKHFLSAYWVKDAAGRTDVTSPVYYDITDICDEMDIFTTNDDMLNCYARRLYDNASRTNMKVYYYQYYAVTHDYLEHPLIPECKTIMKKIAGCIKGDSDFVPADIENDIWCRAMMAERYPKLYEDNEAIKLTDKLGIEHKKRNARYTLYDRTVIMERLVAVDDEDEWYDATSVIVGKSRYYAGRYNLFNGASLSSPLLHAALFTGDKRADFIRYAACIAMEALTLDNDIIIRAAKKMEIRCNEENFAAELDGDAVTTAPLLIEMESEPIKFLA